MERILELIASKPRADLKELLSFISNILKHRPATPSELALLKSGSLISKLIKEKQNPEATAELECLLCSSSLECSEDVAATILNGVNQSILWEDIGTYMALARQFVLLDDECKRMRMEMVLGVPSYLLLRHKKLDTKGVGYVSTLLHVNKLPLIALML